ncbi:MAG: glycosyltransferase, partial [Muribaculaceae bacterium]|nr:glycosyltransferase [Muribaculaceae bacterium]
GLLGSLMFLIGFIAVFVVLLLKIIALCADGFNFGVPKSVYFYLSLAFMILGVQFFCTGLIGELITRNSAERNNYLIAEEF